MGQAFNPYQRGPGQYGQQGGFGMQGAGGRPAAGNFRPAGGGGGDEGDSDQPVFQRGKITYEELQKRIQQQQANVGFVNGLYGADHGIKFQVLLNFALPPDTRGIN